VQIPGVHIETLQAPQEYTTAQIDLALKLASLLDRGRLVLAEPPRR
jgi:hypothetical protein